MSLRPPSAAGVVAQIRDLLGLRGEDPSAFLPAQVLEKLERATRERLLEWAARLGLTDLGQLTKDAVAARIHAALRTAGATGSTEPEPLSARKFDLRLGEDEPEAEDIPWGYGQDRVTAMVVDPDRLYVYWEVTDEAIARARAGLGAAGPEAWLNLRVYDVTGRIFDGTNAHGYQDQRIERGDRQWFFHVGRPSSTACVEIGLRSYEGYFVRVARSGRADFPRCEPAAPGEVEWLTVRVATGDIDVPPTSAPGRVPVPSPASEAAHPLPDRLVDVRETRVGGDGEWIERHYEWSDTRPGAWEEGAAHSSWEAGPFASPVDVPLRTIEEWHSTKMTVRTQDGRTHVVYGPWQVVIRGLGGYAARRIVAVWEMRRSWIARGGMERLGSPARLAPGASERAGASERRWLGSSEARLGGASELYRLGASERRLRGGSELRLGGASEYGYRGASERRWGGASEERLRGASERRLGGASELPALPRR